MFQSVASDARLGKRRTKGKRRFHLVNRLAERWNATRVDRGSSGLHPHRTQTGRFLLDASQAEVRVFFSFSLKRSTRHTHQCRANRPGLFAIKDVESD